MKTWPVKHHYHQMGVIRKNAAGQREATVSLPGVIEHSHRVHPILVHSHQACLHSPAHSLDLCPAPTGSMPGEPPLLFSRDTMPEPEITQPGLQNVRVFTDEKNRPRGARPV